MIVCVLGMHRSGTSAMAGLLHSNGVVMGRDNEFRPKPMKENPKGFYENVRFRKINDKILRQYGYKVKSFSPCVPFIYPMKGKIRDRMSSLIEEYDSQYKNWGWKDPRTTLTLYAWLDVLDKLGLITDLRVILMKRNMEQISASMRARGNKEKYRGQFIELTLKYNKCHFYLNCIYRNVKVKIVSFEDELLNKTEELCSRLSSFLNYEISDCSFIDRDISRQSKKEI